MQPARPPMTRALTFAASLAAFVVLWALLALLRADPSVLPGPAEVARTVWEQATEGPLFRHLWATLRRVAIAFGLSMILGAILGYAMGVLPRLNLVAGPWVVVFLNIPALVVIVLCYLWIGLNETAAITAVTLNKTAMVLVTVREGVQAMDRQIGEMARLYRLSALDRLRHVILPQLAPYLAIAARNGIAIIWKIVLVVEFLGRSDGVGFQIHLYFQLFRIAEVLAYAFSFVVVMLAIEVLLLAPWERAATAWRRQGSAAEAA